MKISERTHETISHVCTACSLRETRTASCYRTLGSGLNISRVGFAHLRAQQLALSGSSHIQTYSVYISAARHSPVYTYVPLITGKKLVKPLQSNEHENAGNSYRKHTHNTHMSWAIASARVGGHQLSHRSKRLGHASH